MTGGKFLLFLIISENLERSRFREFVVSRLNSCYLFVRGHLSVNLINVCLDSALCVRCFNGVKEKLGCYIALFLIYNNFLNIVDCRKLVLNLLGRNVLAV